MKERKHERIQQHTSIKYREPENLCPKNGKRLLHDLGVWSREPATYTKKMKNNYDAKEERIQKEKERKI